MMAVNNNLIMVVFKIGDDAMLQGSFKAHITTATPPLENLQVTTCKTMKVTSCNL